MLGKWLLPQRMVRERVVGEVIKNVDFSGAARLFFAGIRTPASMVAGSSLAALFTTSKIFHSKTSQRDQFLLRLYHALMLSSFTLAFNVVAISTLVNFSLLRGEFNPRAPTAYIMLRREFEYEFVMTRWCFIVALLCFITGATTRAILEFDLLTKRRRNLGLGIGCIMLSLLCSMLSYMNETLYCWDNLFSMTIYLLQLLVRKAIDKESPMQMVSILSGAIGSFFIIKVVVTGATFSDDEKDGTESTPHKGKKE